jgi:hypothetical protein
MAEQTRDELAAEILKDSRTWAPRTPRALARDARRQAHRDVQALTPERERIIANMRHPYAHYKTIMDRQTRIAVQDSLTEDDKDELAQTHLDMDDSPYLQPPEVKASFNGVGPDHYQEWLQEWFWDNHWWAAYQGQTIEVYLGGLRHDLWGPLTRAAIKNSPPMPEGYVVTTRR